MSVINLLLEYWLHKIVNSVVDEISQLIDQKTRIMANGKYRAYFMHDYFLLLLRSSGLIKKWWTNFSILNKEPNAKLLTVAMHYWCYNCHALLALLAIIDANWHYNYWVSRPTMSRHLRLYLSALWCATGLFATCTTAALRELTNVTNNAVLRITN